MSSKTQLASSSSASSIVASSTAGEDFVVPSLGADFGAADVQYWYDATQLAAQTAGDFEGRSDRASHRMLSMILLDAELHDAEFYKAKIKLKAIGLPQNQDKLTLAIACHIGIDVSHVDKTVKTNNSKALNRFVSAGRQLKSEAIDSDGKLKVPFDADGVSRLTAIVAEKGGINALMKIFLATKKGEIRPDIVELDPDSLAELRMQRLAERLSGGRELIVGLGRRDGEMAISVDEEIRLTAAVKNAIASQFSFPRENVQFLKELLTIGHCVEEVMTDQLVNRFDDPNDKSAPRRRARRHYVFDPDGKITVSPILSDTSVLVKVAPVKSLLDRTTLGHVEFRTQQLSSVEANLAGDRADAFDLNIEDANNTQNGVARLKLSSQAAAQDIHGGSKSVNLLVQQVYSKSGTLPLALDAFMPKYSTTSKEALAVMKEVAELCRDAVKKVKPVAITCSASKISFAVGSVERSIEVANAPKNFSLNVRADDFSLVLKVLGNVEINTDIRLELDPEMLVLAFDTASASYAVYIPKQGVGGSRSTRFMRRLEPQLWPGPVASEGDELC